MNATGGQIDRQLCKNPVKPCKTCPSAALFDGCGVRLVELKCSAYLQGVYCFDTREHGFLNRFRKIFYGSEAQDNRLDCHWCNGRSAYHGATAGGGPRRHGTFATGRVAAARGSFRHGQDRLCGTRGRKETDHRRHLGHGRQSGPAFSVFRQEVVQGVSRGYVGPFCRRGHRNHPGRRVGQGGVPD